MNIINGISKALRRIPAIAGNAGVALMLCATTMSVTSCQDFFDVDSDLIVDLDKSHLANATDTIYSVTGILSKMQAIADRTVLLGEARGDLVSITDATPTDLRAVANFEIGDDNIYNRPSDYYAIINNCNYFIANADTAMKNNRNEYIFKKEYVAVKAMRAWTYLQLALVYGEVPFVTDPILTEEEAEKDYPKKDIKGICDYFLNEDKLKELYNDAWDYPNYSDIKSIPSRLLFVPLTLVLGDLNLWAENYLEAADWYHYYLTNRNGVNSAYPTNNSSVQWTGTEWLTITDSYTNQFNDKSNGRNSEVISVIPTDSLPSEKNYSQLRYIFHTSSDNNYKASLVPSDALKSLSAAQNYYYNNEGDIMIAPKNMDDPWKGDMRLGRVWQSSENSINKAGERYTSQTIAKYPTNEAPRINTYRRTLVYLRLAEAMNRAGFPRYAYHILASGVNNEVITDSIAPEYPELPEGYLVEKFGFNGTSISNTTNTYVVRLDPTSTRGANTYGIHSRGCGFTVYKGNAEGYQMPYDPSLDEFEVDEETGEMVRTAASIQKQRDYQIEAVENMIVDEMALELSFEGYRFFDLMRVAMRRNDPSYLANKIMASRKNPSEIKVDLTDQKNWFLSWNGKIGLKK